MNILLSEKVNLKLIMQFSFYVKLTDQFLIANREIQKN